MADENRSPLVFGRFEVSFFIHPLLPLISTRRPNLVLDNKEQRNCHLVDFVVPVDHRVKMQNNSKIDKYLDLNTLLKKKKIWLLRVTVIQIV